MTAAKRSARDVGLRLLPSGRWQARYTDEHGTSIAQTFGSKAEAKTWRAGQIADVARGVHVSPVDRRTVTEWARVWIDSRPLRSGTSKRYDGMLSAHLVGTRLGSMRLVEVRTSHVQAWITDRSVRLAPSTTARLFTFVASLMKAAQADRIIAWSPCDGVVLPVAESAEHVLVTAEQVDAIEAEVPERYRTLMRLLATTGLRIGEALALTADDVDRERQVIRVRRTLDQRARSAGPVKSARHSKRDVPVTREVLARLAAHRLAHPPAEGLDLGPLLFTSAYGRPLRYDVLAFKVFRPAAERAGAKGVTPHALRHYAGSAMLHDGVPPTTVAKVLGHSVETLLRTYAHALPSGDDLVRASMARRSRSGTGLARQALAD